MLFYMIYNIKALFSFCCDFQVIFPYIYIYIYVRTYAARAEDVSGNDLCTEHKHLTASLKHSSFARARLTALFYSMYFYVLVLLMYIKIQLPRMYVTCVHRDRRRDVHCVQMLHGVLPQNIFRS